MKNIITIGITGGIGSGKSYVCRMLHAMGYPVFYSDKIAKDIMVSSSEAITEIKTLFGKQAYQPDGSLNKKHLSTLLFNDDSLRERMNQIVHPKVRRAFEEMAEESNSEYIFNEAAILFETGAHEAYDKMVLVTASKDLKIQRVMKRDDISYSDVEAIMNAQWTDEQKIPLSDFIINNNEKEMLLPQLAKLVEKLRY
ncbi:MAG: dephospho-CoA kinase [Arenicella sp.]|jgi:dephospho-CoA kinase